MKKPVRLAVVSICKNEEKTIGELFRRVPKKIAGVDEIDFILMNDGSTDKTGEVAKKVGAKVYGNTPSKGLALRFREVVDIVLAGGYDVMVNIDGDLQFSPEDIPLFVEPIVRNQADFVAADRFTDPSTGKKRRPKNMPAAKYYGNQMGAWVVSKISRQKFVDVTCGFRGYNQDALYALNLNNTHTYTQESFQILANRHMRILSIPVVVKYFKERKSRVVTSVPKYIIASMGTIVRAFRDFAPMRFFFSLGLVPFIVGVAFMIFVGIHWLNTGNLTPYKAFGFLGVYLFSAGLILWALGMVADMNVRLLSNQEKTYEQLRRLMNKK